MKKIAVFGLACDEKEDFVKQLNELASQDYSFESSTPDDRFSKISTGSIYTRPWQLLLISIDHEKSEAASSIAISYPECDLKRPLIIIFYGKDMGNFEWHKKDLSAVKFVNLIYVKKTNEVATSHLINIFMQLEYKKLAIEASTFSF